MRRTIGLAMVFAAASLASSARADIVVTFDDLVGDGQLADGYAGIIWNDQWAYFDAPQDPYNPASGSQRIYNLTSSGDRPQEAAFDFSAPVIFKGAYFAGYDFVTVHFDLYLGGSLVASSAGINPTDVPTFLSSGYGGLVDRVVVFDDDPSQTYNYYVMDNVTYATAVPEPSTVVVGLFGGLGLLGYTWRRRGSATA